MHFEEHYESELLQLEHELQTQTYHPKRSICFVVTTPMIREIFAADFRDRIVHHLLYNILAPQWERRFIAHSYACRPQKGTHKSVQDVHKSLRTITQNHSREAFYLHLDIRGFFMSIDKNILFTHLKKHTKNPRMLWLLHTVIFHDPTTHFLKKGNPSLFEKVPYHKSLFHQRPNCGLPIGNITSQFFANIYLNELDQFIKHTLKVRFYFRYVDDFLLLSTDQNQLLQWRAQIEEFLATKLSLRLNPNKDTLKTVDSGIDWLGYIIRPHYILMRRRIVHALKTKLYYFNQELVTYQSIKPSQKPTQLTLPLYETAIPYSRIIQMIATINAYYGYFRHAKTYNLRQKLWQTHFKELRYYVEPADKKHTFMRLRTTPLESQNDVSIPRRTHRT